MKKVTEKNQNYVVMEFRLGESGYDVSRSPRLRGQAMCTMRKSII